MAEMSVVDRTLYWVPVIDLPPFLMGRPRVPALSGPLLAIVQKGRESLVAVWSSAFNAVVPVYNFFPAGSPYPKQAPSSHF